MQSQPNKRFQRTVLALRARPAAEARRWTAPSTAQALRTRMRIGGWIWMKIKTAIFLVSYTAVFALLGW